MKLLYVASDSLSLGHYRLRLFVAGIGHGKFGTEVMPRGLGSNDRLPRIMPKFALGVDAGATRERGASDRPVKLGPAVRQAAASPTVAMVLPPG